MQYATVIQSLIEWVEETGRPGQRPPDEIAQFEALGCVVDLETGRVLPGRAGEG